MKEYVNISPLVLTLLNKRGIDSDEKLSKFLSPSDDSFYDPFLLNDMDKLVQRVEQAMKNQEKILIFGDYDVDGITATSILYLTLKKCGADVSFMVPDRFSDGYGLQDSSTNRIIEEGYSLVITVDNGITAVDEIKILVDAGIKVILTDHHEPKEILPPTEYIIHSFLDETYPFKELSGVGVAFKVSMALDKEYAISLIELAMLGTIADMMTIIDENKAIVNEGLKNISNTKLPGLYALLKAYDIEAMSIKDISYNVAPKINSLGRLGKAELAIKLLISQSKEEIKGLIDEALEADEIRKEITIQNTEMAYKMVNEEDNINILASKDFYEGVLGIIAQKVAKKTGKVTGVFALNDQGQAKGSFRSAGNVNRTTVVSRLEGFRGLQ